MKHSLIVGVLLALVVASAARPKTGVVELNTTKEIGKYL